jgi:hypothetical protein
LRDGRDGLVLRNARQLVVPAEVSVTVVAQEYRPAPAGEQTLQLHEGRAAQVRPARSWLSAVGRPTPAELAPLDGEARCDGPARTAIQVSSGVAYPVHAFDMFSVFRSLAVVLHSNFPAPWPPPVP